MAVGSSIKLVESILARDREAAACIKHAMQAAALEASTLTTKHCLALFKFYWGALAPVGSVPVPCLRGLEDGRAQVLI